jgi:hypothetical protein
MVDYAERQEDADGSSEEKRRPIARIGRSTESTLGRLPKRKGFQEMSHPLRTYAVTCDVCRGHGCEACVWAGKFVIMARAKRTHLWLWLTVALTAGAFIGLLLIRY